MSATTGVSKVRRLIGGAGVVGLTGENGSGKTSIGVEAVRQHVEGGGLALSTVGIDAPGVELVTSWQQVLAARNVLLLLDEIEVIASNRDTMTLTHDARVFFSTLRHRHVRVIWTAPTFEDVDVKIRRVTQRTVMCRPAFLGRGPIEPETGWPTTRTAGARSYRVTRDHRDPMPDLKRAMESVRVRLDRLPSRGLFDTHADIAEFPSSGDCSVCGLPRRRQFCSGKH